MRVLIFVLILTILAAQGAMAQVSATTVGNPISTAYAAVSVAAGILAAAAVLVMLWGCAQALWLFFLTEIGRGRTPERGSLRSRLGRSILFGLELLIVADVLETITAPDFQHVLVLAMIVAIRTVISFSLNWELSQEDKRRDVDQD